MDRTDRKKQRPYTEFERQLLIQLVQSKINTVENRKTDGISQRKKNEAWDDITSQFNNSPNVTQTAEVKQLKKMWQNLKAKAREAKTLEAQRKRTGGGPPPPETGSLESQVLSIMPSIMPVISVPIDSDTTAEPFGSGQEDDDTLYWQHKRARVILENDLINETFMVIPDDLDMTHNAPDCKINKTLPAEPEMRKETPIENHTQDTSNMLLFTPKQQIQKICNGSAKQKKSFDDVKKDLLLQELDNNKKRFLVEMEQKKEKHGSNGKADKISQNNIILTDCSCHVSGLACSVSSNIVTKNRQKVWSIF